MKAKNQAVTEISPIEKMMVAAIAECKYESSVESAWKGLYPQIKAAFPDAELDRIYYYWEKASKAKKSDIRRGMNGL